MGGEHHGCQMAMLWVGGWVHRWVGGFQGSKRGWSCVQSVSVHPTVHTLVSRFLHAFSSPRPPPALSSPQGTLQDHLVLQERLRRVLGDMTFAEAYQRSGGWC